MLSLEELQDPLSEESLEIQYAILNSDPYFLQHAEGKIEIPKVQIIQENLEYLSLGAKFYFLKKSTEIVGLAHYVPYNPYDHTLWLSLFIIDKAYQKNKLGYKGYLLFEDFLREKHNVDKIRLCVQVQNKRGARFWEQNGYKKVMSTIDQKNLHIDIYDKIFS
ncbi:GNAT family N-acetyltransferase [Anaerobacillus alkaliphilus]|uniref:GNAT family N-acetyltransferase n=1 Tax=Anaerobacillus alkaliphilus TaxID=1548597 RepID=UPI0013760C1A|nr:GNAT family N-acetyltransferase [Anaerobacillus alkaliphilus]